MHERFTSPDRETDLLIAKHLGEIAVEGIDEDMEDVFIPEADEEIVSTLRRRPEGWVLLACGDDRGISKGSSEHLKGEGLPADRPYLRYFGGPYGVARVSQVAAVAQYGPAILKELDPNKDFVLYSAEFSRLAEKNTEVIATAHSAVKNELDDSTLNPRSSAPLACAYALNIGEVSYIGGFNGDVRRLAAAEYAALFGPHSDPEKVEEASDASREVSVNEFGKSPREFSVTRSDLLSTGVTTMLVEGEHARSMDTFLLANFSVDKLSDPNAAQEIGRPYYGIDFTQTAEVIMKSLPKLKLDPEILFATMMLDVAATRAALAAHDGTANPERISLVRYGEPEEALDYLRSLQ